MIEPTDEMGDAYAAAYVAARTNGAEIPAAEREALRAVLAVVARDRCLERRGHVYHPLAAPPREPTAGQCGAAGPDGLRCERAPRHLPFFDEQEHHAAYDGSGVLVRW